MPRTKQVNEVSNTILYHNEQGTNMLDRDEAGKLLIHIADLQIIQPRLVVLLIHYQYYLLAWLPFPNC